MLPFEYIKSELNNFILKFPKTRVRYENDTNSNTHSIEILPNEIYLLDNNYIAWEETFFDTFIAQYPNQNICFISDNAIVGLDKIDFEIIGKEYVSYQTIAYNVNSKLNLLINIQSKENENFVSIKQQNYFAITTTKKLNINLLSQNLILNNPILNQYEYPLAA